MTSEMPGPIPSVPCQCTGSGYVDKDTGCVCGVSVRTEIVVVDFEEARRARQPAQASLFAEAAE